MAEEIKLIHTADTHIGYRQYHSDIRRHDFLKAFENIVNDAIEMDVAAIIHAGDLFDSRNPTLEDILQTMEILSRLKASNIPFLAIVGNHESKQNTQWLDLFQSMELAARLGSEPYVLSNCAIYGIDSIPKPKIAGFDYSVFSNPPENINHVFLAMHQLVTPFPFGEWDTEKLISSMPFSIDALLLGDYHKYEKTKIGDTWLTYPGSTERNSAAEKETRGYNLITISDMDIDIGRRNLQTRDFLYLKVSLKPDSETYRDIFNAIKENDVLDSVVFLEIDGDTSQDVSYNQIEEFILKEGAIACRINDKRISGQEGDEERPKISFADPDLAVKEEIRKMGLTKGGLLIDEIVRDLTIPKSNIDHASEDAFRKMLEEMDFSKLPETASKTDEIEKEEIPEKVEETIHTEIQETPEFLPQTPEDDSVEPEEPAVSEREEKQKERKPRQYNLGDYL
ncbi:DNA repair exonuclease SbcCD nuclease subunit [Methanohalophilus levihalophilus]|uniref:metallophosphoesterase family protein n=1 Tax=Methanohalophilus levihalophilus TaxID=1431282 RepID=UPI001AE2BCFA|nr:exonuclease SbcCD subunit D [Methanohalophilus levihalophilus]MBP2030721.1 DNA repair exonuclease SbcCD nuclease subunit [Methanohalophilus levihalophilus]